MRSAALASEIEIAYRLILDRNPDEIGRKHLLSCLEDGSTDLVEIYKGLLVSIEYRMRRDAEWQSFASKLTNLSTDADLISNLIQIVYRLLLRREPDDVGYSNREKLIDRSMQLSEFIRIIEQSSEYLLLQQEKSQSKLMEHAQEIIESASSCEDDGSDIDRRLQDLTLQDQLFLDRNLLKLIISYKADQLDSLSAATEE